MGARTAARLTLAAYIAAVVLFLVAIAGFYQKNTGFTSLIRFGDQFYLRTLPAVRYAPHVTHLHSSGYDGQFYAQLATEPLARNRALEVALDGPPYRARRILFAWTAYVMGLGEPALIVKAFALQNILVWLALALLMMRWLPPSRPRHLVPWVGCLFAAGMLGSVANALLDGPSMLVMTLAILAHERGRHWWAAILMGASGLGRESNLVGAGLLWRGMPTTAREWGREAVRLAIVVVPLLAWGMYVRSLFPGYPDAGPSNLAVPFAGYLAKWKVALAFVAEHGWRSEGGRDVVILASVTIQAVFLCVYWKPRNAWWRMSAPYVLLMAVTAFIVWDGTPGAAPRVLLPMTFGFNVLVADLRGRWFWPLAMAGNLSVLAGLPQILRL